MIELYNIIENWVSTNKDAIIQGFIISVLVGSFFKTVSISYKKAPKIIKVIKSIKFIKYIEFIILYLLPIGTILSMILDQTMLPSFKNIGILIVICLTFIYNILMSHINSIYKMISELAYKCNDSNLTYTKVINTILEEIGRKERIK